MASDAPILELRDITVKFGDETVYRDMSFSVREGEFLCILGPSGCGKSTSLRLIGDLLDVQEGTVLVEGLPPREAWHKLAYVFQSPRLAPWRTALANVTLGMELRFDRTGKAEREATAKRYLSLVGLAADMHKYPGMLSGGDRQRVSIARALAVHSDIILMDEPFSALDLNTRRRLRSELISIWRETGKTIVFVTHDIDEALTLADRILLLSNKPTRVLEVMSLDEERPRALDTAPTLRARRDQLVAMFEELERNAPEENTQGKELAS
ncbi:MAG: ABC transporter ATP-binding protein [Bauldia litoralis]